MRSLFTGMLNVLICCWAVVLTWVKRTNWEGKMYTQFSFSILSTFILWSLHQKYIQSSHSDNLPRAPLHYASANGNYQCVVALVSAGAEVNELDLKGCGPLHFAAASQTFRRYALTHVLAHPLQIYISYTAARLHRSCISAVLALL